MNLLPFITLPNTPSQLISTWMYNGTLLEYVGSNSDVDRLGLVSAPSLCPPHNNTRYQVYGVVNGLRYLHSCGVIHGGIHAVRSSFCSCVTTVSTPSQSNVLVGPTGQPQIASTGRPAIGWHPHHSRPQWIAPEISSDTAHTKAADIFSFGVLVVEVRCRYTQFIDICDLFSDSFVSNRCPRLQLRKTTSNAIRL